MALTETFPFPTHSALFTTDAANDIDFNLDWNFSNDIASDTMMYEHKAFKSAYIEDQSTLLDSFDFNGLGGTPVGISSNASGTNPVHDSWRELYPSKAMRTLLDEPEPERQSGGCRNSLLALFQALHVPAPSCLNAADDITSRWPRTMNSILSLNKKLLAKVIETVHCTCSQNFQEQMLLTVICGKLITWNQALISAELNKIRPSPVIQPAEQVLLQPITLGQTQIDDADLERTLRMHIIVGEFHNIERVINAVCNQLLEADAAARVEAKYNCPATPLAKGVRVNLATFLGQRLQALRAALADLRLRVA